MKRIFYPKFLLPLAQFVLLRVVRQRHGEQHFKTYISSVRNYHLIMNNDLVRMWKEVAVACVEILILPYHLLVEVTEALITIEVACSAAEQNDTCSCVIF